MAGGEDAGVVGLEELEDGVEDDVVVDVEPAGVDEVGVGEGAAGVIEGAGVCGGDAAGVGVGFEGVVELGAEAVAGLDADVFGSGDEEPAPT